MPLWASMGAPLVVERGPLVIETSRTGTVGGAAPEIRGAAMRISTPANIPQCSLDIPLLPRGAGL